MLKKVKCIGLIFLCMFFSHQNSYGLTITDSSVLRQVLTCPNRETIELGNASFCNQWVIDVEDSKAVSSATIADSGMKVRCASWQNVNSGSSFSDNLGFSTKGSTYHKDYTHTTYRCSDGNVLNSNSCNVFVTTERRNCRCGNCECLVGCGFLCLTIESECKNGEYRVCKPGTDCWNALWDFQCARDIYNTSSTPISNYNEYYRYWLYRCNNPAISVELLKVYDPNLIRN